MSERTDEDWIWRYGMRETAIGPDGVCRYDPRPLTREEFIHPQEGDRLLEDTRHHRTSHYLNEALQYLTADEVGTGVLSKVGLDFGAGGVRPMCADISLHRELKLPVPPTECPIRLSALGGIVDLVIEVTGWYTRDVDLEDKVPLYHRAGVLHYLVIDHGPEAEWDRGRLVLHRWTPERFVSVEPEPSGRLWVEPLRAWIEMQGQEAVMFDANWKRVPTWLELYRHKQRVDRIAKKIEQIQADTERIKEILARAGLDSDEYRSFRREADARIDETRAELTQIKSMC